MVQSLQCQEHSPGGAHQQQRRAYVMPSLGPPRHLLSPALLCDTGKRGCSSLVSVLVGQGEQYLVPCEGQGQHEGPGRAGC